MHLNHQKCAQVHVCEGHIKGENPVPNIPVIGKAILNYKYLSALQAIHTDTYEWEQALIKNIRKTTHSIWDSVLCLAKKVAAQNQCVGSRLRYAMCILTL